MIEHRWHIDEVEYQRHERRRGRRHAFTDLSPAATCLVVVDMVPFFVNELTYAKAVVAKVSQLADALRSAGGIIAWVTPSSDPLPDARREFYGEAVAERYRLSGGLADPVTQIGANFAVDDSDLVLKKSASSALSLGSCGLHDALQQRSIETLIVAGAVANVCCESTARDANSLGYRTIFLADANAAVSDEMLNATLRTLYRSFSDVRTTADLLTMIRH